MKQLIYISLLFALLSSCVTKKKYQALQQQHQLSLADKVTLEDVYTRITLENDSLKNQLSLLDSLLRQANIKKNAEAPTVVTKKKSSSISKTQEYDTKALYIYSITKYIFWPNNTAHVFVIGIVGDSKLNAALVSYMLGKKIHGLPVVIEPYNPDSKKTYQVVIISENQQQQYYKVSKQLKGQPVLFIAEDQYMDKAGAHVAIYPDGNKIKFSVNENQIQKTGLSVSGMLIKLAQTTSK